MIKSYCSKCRKVIEYKPYDKLCSDCKVDKKKPKYIRDENITQEMQDKFYMGKKWQRVRLAAINRDEGLCQICYELAKEGLGTLKPMDEVHHVIPILSNWKIRYYLGNLICLCRNCHKDIHKLEVYGEDALYSYLQFRKNIEKKKIK